MIDDEEGRGIGSAVFVVMMNIVFAIIFFFLIGSIMCGILPPLTNIGIDETSPFAQALSAVPNLVNIFFQLPLIFIILLFVWLFKYIVKKHKYTYQEEGGEEEW